MRFRLSCDKNAPNLCRVNIGLNSWAIISKNGGTAKLDAIFPGMLSDADSGYDVALEFDLDTLKDPADFLEQMSDVKKHLIGAPMEVALNALKKGTVTNSDLVRVTVRGDHSIFIVPKTDRVVIILHVLFNESTDKSLSRIFMQEFVEAKRTVTGLSIPNVSYTKDAPTELAGQAFGNLSETSGFLLFQFEKRTLEGADCVPAAVHLLTGFRAYLLYHIKATKTYLHMRMRKRVADWLQVLNRAKPKSDETKEKKGISGKTLSTAGSNAHGR